MRGTGTAFAGWRAVFVVTMVAWALALAYSTVSARSLYGDGGWYVLVHLITPHRFNDYDFHRSFASYLSQAPVLFGQRMGAETVATYAALYSVGAFVFPAIAMGAAMYLSRRQALLFAANAFAVAIYGFGTNFINTEANLQFGLVWLAITLLALEGPAPRLRGLVLPLAAFVLLRAYEGMLLVGPILALWALLRLERDGSERERVGLTVSALLFAVAAAIGLGGFLAPRDLANASSFLGSALRYLANPQRYVLASALLALGAVFARGRGVRLACAALAAAAGVVFVVAIARLEGFYSFDVYYQNRSFMALSLPACAALLMAIDWRRPAWLALAAAPGGHAALLIPVIFSVAGDAVGTYRWRQYVAEFCGVLGQEATPAERLAMLGRSGVRTAWPWTHPTLSVLLRDRGTDAMVTNEPGRFGWEPFDPRNAPAIPYRGLCQAPLFAPARLDSFDSSMTFMGGRFPTYVASVSGLSVPEPWGTWTEGPELRVDFAKPLPAAFDLALRIGTAFGANKGAPVRVTAGNAEQDFEVDREPYETTLHFRGVEPGATTISFVIPHPESPQERGSGSDPRKLGIGLVSLRVIPK